MSFTLTKFRLCADNGLTIFKGNIHLLPLKEVPVLRIASLMPWPLKSIFFALCLPFFLVGIAWAQDTETEIDYTGSLLGYYRVEPIQGAPALTPVSKFIAALNQQQGHLLLGMGDNFGPEFGASLQLDGGPNSSCPLPPKHISGNESIPESLYKDDDRIARLAQCDNVLNFMMQAGFRAVVPGRQDFMYTARWLRGVARLAADESSKPSEPPLIRNKENQLYILGANLRISLKGYIPHMQPGEEGGPYKVSGRCPLLFSKDPLGHDATQCGFDGKQADALDWLDRIDRLARAQGDNMNVENTTEIAIEQAAEAGSGTPAGKPSALATLVHDQVEIMLAAWGTRFDLSELRGLPDKIEPPKGKVTPAELMQALDQGIAMLREMKECPDESPSGITQRDGHAPTDTDDLCTYKNVLTAKLTNFKKIQEHMPVQDKYPLGDQARDAAIRGLLRTVADEEENAGYTVVINQVTRQKILVIGVVGRETMKAVSQTNLRLCGISPPAVSTGLPDFADCHELSNSRTAANRVMGNVEVGDPVLVTAALVRAAWLKFGGFDRVVVMAQMPHTDAEVLATRVWAKLRAVDDDHQVDLVLSEAQAGYGTSNLTLTYSPNKLPSTKMATTHPAMVLTPVTSYSPSDGVFPGAVSRATIKSDIASAGPARQYSIENRSSELFDPTALLSENRTDQKSNITTVSLLLTLMAKLQGISPPAAGSKLEDEASKSRTVMMLLEALQKASKPRADVVLLQSRDILLDQIGANYTEKDSKGNDPQYYGYTDYHVCNGEPAEKQRLCQLRVALDRIFWKGDYIEFVAMTGKSLKSILDLSKSKSDERIDLQDKDITGEWLISYGIVQSSLSNLTQINQNSEPLWIPVDSACKGQPSTDDGEKSSQSVYCIGGTPIADDAFYWVLTTDQLAQDKEVYGTFQALPAAYHKTSSMFITHVLAHYLQDHMQDPDIQFALNGGARTQQKRAVAEYPVIKSNVAFQQRPLWQVDFAKTIASFAAREPVGGNSFVASSFQGVSDARASAPSQQELDLELGSRITGNVTKAAIAKNLPPMSIGIQSGFAYDRSVLGNLSPGSKIVNPSYTLNNLTVGGFLQLRLEGGPNDVRPVRSLPRDLLVFTPHQYQVQVNNSYLFFSYTAPHGITPPTGQLTVTLPRNSSWTDRVGFRREFGQNRANSFFQNGSYIEGGMEFTVQDNVLSSITLANGSTTKTCQVSSTVTLPGCFYSNAPSPQFLITSATSILGAPAMKALHTPGAYWNLHVQNILYRKGDKTRISLVTESQGDYFFGRPGSAELSTQTNYAIPLSVALVFPSFGNLSFAPTYSGFYYKSQLSNQSLQVNSISIAARWYFARDARVPIFMQRQFPGPASADQNKTGKGH